MEKRDLNQEIISMESRSTNTILKNKSILTIDAPQGIKDLVKLYDGDETIATQENVKLIREKLTELHTDGHLSTAVQLCKGNDCALSYKCPLVMIGRPPLNKECFIESQLIKVLKEEYTMAMVERLNLEFDNILEADIITRNLILELVEADIIELRINAILSVEGFLQEVPALATSDGGIERKIEEHAAFKMKEVVKRRRDNVYKQLLATPEMRIKYRRSDKRKESAKQISDTVHKAIEHITNKNLDKDKSDSKENNNGKAKQSKQTKQTKKN